MKTHSLNFKIQCDYLEFAIIIIMKQRVIFFIFLNFNVFNLLLTTTKHSLISKMTFFLDLQITNNETACYFLFNFS